MIRILLSTRLGERRWTQYVHNQLQEDIAADQLTMKEFTDPFTGEPVKKGK